jgi:hypothetical protein
MMYRAELSLRVLGQLGDFPAKAFDFPAKAFDALVAAMAAVVEYPDDRPERSRRATPMFDVLRSPS